MDDETLNKIFFYALRKTPTNTLHDAIRAVANAAAREALERAATLLESEGNELVDSIHIEICYGAASRIRKLKDEYK